MGRGLQPMVECARVLMAAAVIVATVGAAHPRADAPAARPTAVRGAPVGALRTEPVDPGGRRWR